MAVLNKDEFLARIKGIIGENTDDDSIALLEDLQDTYNDLEGKATDPENWHDKYDQLDKDWRDRYTKRFFSAPAEPDPQPDPKPDDHSTDITINDLFK